MELILNYKDQQFICLYDAIDHELISQYSWSYSNGYAVTTIKGKTVLMHRLILGLIDKPEIEVDHQFHKKLDNRRSEIRACTHTQNLRNSRKLNGFSKFKGVYRDQNKCKVQITNDEKQITIGRFRSEVTAGKVYDKAARDLFGEFANPNFKEVNQDPEQLTIKL
jgi:hypothetical protein